MNLHSALTQLFISIAAELVSKLRQNELARMHEYDMEHFLFQVRIERKRVAQEIVDARDGFDSGEAATCNDKGQQRRAFRPRAFRIGLFEMRDQPIAQLNRVAERLHGQRAFGDAGKIEEIRYRPEREHEMVVFECMGVSIKAADLIQKVRFWLGEGLYYRSQLYVIDLEKMLLAEELPNDLLQ